MVLLSVKQAYLWYFIKMYCFHILPDVTIERQKDSIQLDIRIDVKCLRLRSKESITFKS